MKKLITFYSESHKDIYDIFYESYCKYLQNNFTLKSLKIEQLSPTGEYESQGFDITMLKKIEWIIQNIDINNSELMVFSDCDVQFFQNIDKDLGEYDILFQEDLGSYCAGFFICKQNQMVLDFFNYVYETLKINLNGIIHDQTIINNLLLNNLYKDINVGFLNKNEYWTIANVNGGKVWDGEYFSDVPKEIKIHHANFTIGIENKISLLNQVKNIYMKKTKIPLNTERMKGFGPYVIDNFQVNFLYGLNELCEKYIKSNFNILELGSNDGVSTKLFSYFSNKVTCVDIIKTKNMEKVILENPNIDFYNMSFNEFLEKDKNNKYDLIYIDGNHDYHSVNTDIKLFRQKIKNGGYISGHDYNSITEGVILAVKENFPNDVPQIFSDSSWLIKI